MMNLIDNKLYTSTEVAQILGVSLRSIYRYLDEGNLQAESKTATGRHRFTKQNILDFLYPLQSDQQGDGSQQGVSQPMPMRQGVDVKLEPVSGTRGSVGRMQDMTTGYTQSSRPATSTANANDSQEAAVPTTATMGAPMPAVAPTSQESAPQVATQPEATAAETVEEVNWLEKFREAAAKYSAKAQPAPQPAPQPVAQPAGQPKETIPQNVQVPFQPSRVVDDTRYDIDLDDADDIFGVGDEVAYFGNDTEQSRQQPRVQTTMEPERVPSKATRPDARREYLSSLGSQALDHKEEYQPTQVENKKAFYYKSSIGGLRDLAQYINKVSKKSDIPYAFTMSAGMSLHKLIRPFSMLHVYIRDEDKSFFERALELTPSDETSAQLCMFITKSNTIFSTKNEIHGLNVVSDLQLKKDLVDNGELDLAREFDELLGA